MSVPGITLLITVKVRKKVIVPAAWQERGPDVGKLCMLLDFPLVWSTVAGSQQVSFGGEGKEGAKPMTQEPGNRLKQVQFILGKSKTYTSPTLPKRGIC